MGRTLMVWGTASARRACPEPGRRAQPAHDFITASPPPTVECARCETPAVLFTASDCCSDGVGAPNAALPKGWALVAGKPHCPDCRRGPSRLVSPRPPSTAPRGLRPIGPDQAGRYRGCRVGHEIALGHAAIQVRAGASPPPGRDEAVQFLLDANGFDELIIELSAIRAELVAQGVRADD